MDDALGFCRQAASLRPGDPRYALTKAFYLNRKGDRQAAAGTLEDFLRRQPGIADGYLMLAEIYAKSGDRQKAEEIFTRANGNPALNLRDRSRIEAAYRAYREARGQDQKK